MKDYLFHGERILELEDGKWMWGHTAGRIYILSPTNYSENLFPIDEPSQKKLLEIAPTITLVADKALLYQRIIMSNPYCLEAHKGIVDLYSADEWKFHYLLRAAAIFLGHDRSTAEGFIRQANSLAKKSTNLGIRRRLLSFLSYVREKET